MPSIRIDKLNIRLRGVPKNLIEPSFYDLGDKIAQQLKANISNYSGALTCHIDHLHLGALDVKRGMTPGQLKQKLAEKIVTGINSNIINKQKERK